MDNLTIYNINKKDANGQYYWSDKDVFKYNERMKKDKKPKQDGTFTFIEKCKESKWHTQNISFEYEYEIWIVKEDI